MGLFRKRIDQEGAAKFFSMAHSKTLSSKEMVENVARLAKLKEAFPILKNVQQDAFDRNLSAVNLVWLRIAWTRYSIPRGVSAGDKARFDQELEADLEEKLTAYGLIKHLVVFYQRAAHDTYHMNTSLAMAFVAEIIGEDEFRRIDETDPQGLADVIAAISGLFLGTYEAYLRALKRSKALR